MPWGIVSYQNWFKLQLVIQLNLKPFLVVYRIDILAVCCYALSLITGKGFEAEPF
jgi:hypothetical protein